MFCLRRSRQKAVFQRLWQLVKAELPVTKRKRLVALGEDIDNTDQTFLSHLPFPDLNFLLVKHHICKVFFAIVNFSFFIPQVSLTSFIFFFLHRSTTPKNDPTSSSQADQLNPQPVNTSVIIFAIFRRIPLRDKQKTKTKLQIAGFV